MTRGTNICDYCSPKGGREGLYLLFLFLKLILDKTGGSLSLS